jgi:hypothetical protein
MVLLREVAQAGLGQGVAAGRGDVMSVEEDVPGLGFQPSGEALE